ncbi:MAG: 23S rRNA (uracil(1939)-C(5))-methyltransferase RlmD [Flavobacteriales bacterium]|nr:23S rRNA (uracil(1939)-C(5))-methyltransferase RlmD [Flavobacteriales bacterium]
MEIKKGNVYEFTIDDLAYGGKGICRIPTEEGNYVVFIPNSIPGQTILTRIVKKRRNYAEGRALKLISRSEDEIQIPYQEVSGAPYATLPLPLQRKYKERDSLDQFKKLGSEEVIQRYDGMIASPIDWCYRNKMEYSFSAILWNREDEDSIDEFGLGFKKRGMWWAVEDLKKPSGLFDKEFEKGILNIKDYCEASGLPAWHAPQRKGFFRSLLVRKSFQQNKFMIALMTSSDGLDSFDLDKFAEFLLDLYPSRIAGIIHTLSDSEGDRFEYKPEASKLIWGEDHLIEDLLGLKFKKSLSSFFQTNPASAEVLYQKVIDLVEKYRSTGITLDLFCGTGTIAQLIARQLQDQKVVGVDITKSSIEDAQKNALINSINNVEFISSDVGKFLQAHPEYSGKIGTIILDPPRNGVETKTLQKVIGLCGKTIVYVSCNPSTQARDAKLLIEAGYYPKYYTLVDQFPHTSHIEGIAVFTK